MVTTQSTTALKKAPTKRRTTKKKAATPPLTDCQLLAKMASERAGLYSRELLEEYRRPAPKPANKG